MNENRFERFELERGADIGRIGVHGEGRLIAWRTDEAGEVISLSVTWKGYGENPGSRYSGLFSYYPAETNVYQYLRTDQFGRRVYTCILSWQTKPPKTK